MRRPVARFGSFKPSTGNWNDSRNVGGTINIDVGTTDVERAERELDELQRATAAADDTINIDVDTAEVDRGIRDIEQLLATIATADEQTIRVDADTTEVTRAQRAIAALDNKTVQVIVDVDAPEAQLHRARDYGWSRRR